MLNIRIIPIFFLVAGLASNLQTLAQTPSTLTYMAVLRDTGYAPISNAQVGLRLSIVKDSINGPVVYAERHQPVTSANGLVNVNLGNGNSESGDFSTIDWATGTYFVEMKADAEGGDLYTISGKSQLLSVPSALHANSVNLRVSVQGDTLLFGLEDYVIVPGLSPWPPRAIFCNGTPTEVIEVMNSLTGQIWMDRNLGASRVAESVNDTLAYGDLYQWGRFGEGHQCRQSPHTNTLARTPERESGIIWYGQFITVLDSPGNWLVTPVDNLWEGAEGMNNPCPRGYRLPTASEWESERQSWVSNDLAGGYDSALKLSAVGYRAMETGEVINAAESLYYWTGSASGGGQASILIAGQSVSGGIYSLDRATGSAVRCIKN